jgi:hypothetical protein
MIRKQVFISKEDDEALRKIAYTERMSQSEIIRSIYRNSFAGIREKSRPLIYSKPLLLTATVKFGSYTLYGCITYYTQ